MFAYQDRGLRDWFPKRRSPSREGLPCPNSLHTEARTLVVASTRQVLRQDVGRTRRCRRVQSSGGRSGRQAANPNDVVVGTEVRGQGQCEGGDGLVGD